MTIEELQEELVKQKEENQNLHSQIDQLTKEKTDLETSNKQLTVYNNKLFMRVSQQMDEDTEEDKEPDIDPEDQLAQDIVNDIIGE